MNIRLIRPVLLAITLMLLAAPAAHAALQGDSSGAPVLMALNTTKTVKHIEDATLQPVVEETDCDPLGDTTNSVWFAFTMPVFGHVDIDGSGAIIEMDTEISSWVVMSLYERAGLPLEIDCTAGDAPRLLYFMLQPGEYLVRIANYEDTPATGPSQYRLSLRARFLGDFMQDGSFDEQPLGAPWTLKKAGNPPQITRVCAATCSARFAGKAKAAIQQSVSIAGGVLKGKKGDLVLAGARINNTSIAGADVKVTLAVTYSDGTPNASTSLKRHITQTTTGDDDFYLGNLYIEIASKALKSVKLTISSPKSTDIFDVTEAYVAILAGGSVRDGVLPVPLDHSR